VQSLAGCAESFLGAMVVQHALIDPADAGQPVDADPADALPRLLAAQLALDDSGFTPLAPPMHTAPHPAAGPRRAVAHR
jgi:hypothetical protein